MRILIISWSEETAKLIQPIEKTLISYTDIASYFLHCPGHKIRFIWLMFGSFQGNQNYPKKGILKINPRLEEVGLLELIRNLISWNAVSLWREIDEFLCKSRPDRSFPLHLSKHSIVCARSMSCLMVPEIFEIYITCNTE